MKLYKYVGPHLTSLLQNRLIRFTPPTRFNDPFEMRPYYEALADEQDIREVLAQQPMEDILKEELTLAYARVPDEVQRRVSPEFLSSFADMIAPLAVDAMPDLMDEFAALFRKPLTEGFNEHVGVLSLTEKPDNLLMWAHYAQQHTGFVIEFDGDDAFFHQRRTESDEFGYLRKVNYAQNRPNVVLTKVSSVDMFLTKSVDWEYEQEWRMLQPLKDADHTKMIDGEAIHLFRVPPTSITGVIFGARMNVDKRNEVITTLTNSSDLSHLRISEAVLDERKFKLNIVEFQIPN